MSYTKQFLLKFWIIFQLTLRSFERYVIFYVILTNVGVRMRLKKKKLFILLEVRD